MSVFLRGVKSVNSLGSVEIKGERGVRVGESAYTTVHKLSHTPEGECQLEGEIK